MIEKRERKKREGEERKESKGGKRNEETKVKETKGERKALRMTERKKGEGEEESTRSFMKPRGIHVPLGLGTTEPGGWVTGEPIHVTGAWLGATGGAVEKRIQEVRTNATRGSSQHRGQAGALGSRQGIW